MFKQPSNARKRGLEQLLLRSLTGLSDSRTNAAATGGYLLISRARCPHLVLVLARARKDRVRVRVNESRRDDRAACVNVCSIRACQRLYPRSGSQSQYQAIAHKQCSVFYYRKLAHLSARARARWSGYRNKLRGMSDEKFVNH
jgi:hypothetical protein